MENILTVTELTANIKALLETSFGLLWVTGEISNLRRPASGHVYFTLKDEASQIRAVIFRPAFAKIGFALEDGMSIVCRGRLNVYHLRGEYQIVIDAAEPRGLGALQMAFEQLKGRLDEEGLFEQSRKKKIPFLPRRIGVVTSSTGAAIRDILNITGRRFPSVDILIAPVRVQGVEAPPEICEAISLLNSICDIDVIILTRGGGSLEDLFPFNDERVARAIFSSRIPVISAVGHEIDFTISDFVADLRASTPSAAAELVVPERKELAGNLEGLHTRLISGWKKKPERSQETVCALRERLKDPGKKIADLRIRVDDQSFRIAEDIKRILDKRRDLVLYAGRLLMRANPSGEVRDYRLAVENLKKNVIAGTRFYLKNTKSRLQRELVMLESLNPLSVLKRGYGIVKQLPEGHIVRDANTLAVGNRIGVKLFSGSLKAEVTKVSEE
ncbi:MAG: exodeoxyribonuclease VII large subunit [Thermodesulfobacteriota bacterium]|nr:exodeoxyribonuclease VII large subunit [Thermodesulfobacteriota bacterium]